MPTKKTPVQWSAERLRSELERKDIRLSIEGERLTVDAPRGALDAQLRERVKIGKAGLLALLRSDSSMPSTRPAGLPASSAQQRLWFLDRLGLGLSYNIPVAFDLDGPLSLAALHAALADVAQRHAILRTHLAEPKEGERALTLVVSALAPTLEVADLRAVPAEEARAHLTELCAQRAWSPFELARGPLWRATLFQLDETRHRLLFTFHHCIFDGWSLAIFLRELTVCYAARRSGQPPSLAPLELQYADYARTEQRTSSPRREAELLHYWREQLGGAPPELLLPCDHPRPAMASTEGGRVGQRLEPELVARLDSLARREGVTTSMSLLAVFSVLLARYSRSKDLVVGMPVANRNDARLEGLIGLFADTLALRVRPRLEGSFCELLAHVKHVVREGYAHQDLPFERVVEALAVERSVERSPLFQVLFSYQDDQIGGFALEQTRVHPVELPHTHVAFEFSLRLRRRGEAIEAWFEYATALFERDTIERLAQNFVTLLRGLVAAPLDVLNELPLMTPEELQRSLVTFNAGSSSLGPEFRWGPCVHERVAMQARTRPEAPAVVEGDRTLSYAQLERSVDTLSRVLVVRGIKPGDVVALLLPRSIDIIVSLLAVLRTGAAYLPLDTKQPLRRLAFSLEDSGAVLVLTHSDGPPVPEGVERLELDTLPDTPCPEPSLPAGELDALAYLIYTSGSTGKPKGVRVSHRAILSTWHSYARDLPASAIAPGTTHLQLANPAFDIFTGDWVRTLISGGRLLLCPEQALLDPEHLYTLMQREQVQVANFVPVVSRGLCDYVERIESRMDFMECWISCGEALHLHDYWRMQALCRPDAHVINSYGVTETAVENILADATCVRAQSADASGDGITPIGRPMAHTRVYILDENLRPVPIGVRGELCMAGPALAQGYHRRPELNANRFVEVELEGRRERVYRAGDLARWRPDGVLEFFGRLDHQVKLRGFRIELGEVEAALLEHPAVHQVVVLVRGESSAAMLVAWLEATEGVEMPSPLGASMRAFLDERLPRYMVPSAFVALAHMPVNPNGKIDRRALPDPEATGERGLTPPRNSVELRLVLIWERLLERAPLGVHDDFFALGGDSLLSVRLISMIERELGVRVPLHALFRTANIEALACLIRSEQEQAGPRAPLPWSPLVCLQPAGDKRPLFFVHAAGGIVFRYLEVAALLGTERPFYALQARGVEPGDEPYPSIEVMAAAYVQALREIQPTGPYLLGGWSFGGTVAFEMVRQLEAAGQSVPVLFMIDAPSPLVDDYEQDDVAFLLERLGPAAGLELSEVETHDSREAKLRYLFEQQRLAGLFTPDIAPADAALRLALHKHHNRIGCAYRPGGPCTTQIVFYEPTESIPFDVRMKEPVAQWRPYASEGIEVDRSPGNHFNMFSATNGPILAASLRERIAKLD